MVVGIPAGDLLLVVKRTFIVVDSSEVEQPFDIFTLIGLVVPINFGKELACIVVGVADTTSIVGRIVSPIFEFGNIAGRMGIVVVRIMVVGYSHKFMRL